VLKEAFGIPHISSGDRLRDAGKNETALGLEAKVFMEAGKLVPDDLVLGMMGERLQQDDCRSGFLLDGFPRTVAQGEALLAMLAEVAAPLDHVVSLAVDEDEIVERIRGRREEESRDDDNEETVRQRLRVYRSETAPLLDFYRDLSLLREIDGIGTPEEISSRILASIGAAS
jgi:adenylate kinase